MVEKAFKIGDRVRFIEMPGNYVQAAYVKEDKLILDTVYTVYQIHSMGNHIRLKEPTARLFHHAKYFEKADPVIINPTIEYKKELIKTITQQIVILDNGFNAYKELSEKLKKSNNE